VDYVDERYDFIQRNCVVYRSPRLSEQTILQAGERCLRRPSAGYRLKIREAHRNANVLSVGAKILATMNVAVDAISFYLSEA
jgi:hypothetical protein